ncbi:TPA: GNAT family N-acetyltransferase [Klebsiella aerogenes]|nr:GNAT family N-acetyltransferase [Klebsiella aerogenes]
MPEIVDPTDSLVSFQHALSNGLINPSSCIVHPKMKVLLDNADGTPRITYAFIDGQTVKGVVIYIPVDSIEGKPCFGVAYAVADEYKMQGVGTKLLLSSIAEMQQGFKNSFPEFYIEAIVGVDNLASNKLASKILSATSNPGEDSHSGKPINQYLKHLHTAK